MEDIEQRVANILQQHVGSSSSLAASSGEQPMSATQFALSEIANRPSMAKPVANPGGQVGGNSLLDRLAGQVEWITGRLTGSSGTQGAQQTPVDEKETAKKVKRKKKRKTKQVIELKQLLEQFNQKSKDQEEQKGQ